jgi:RNA polymerase subunit RPABC4/transcription elongation factor Spt4
MARFQQSVSEPWSEKLRLIRFRMAKERLRFSDEIRLVPTWLVALMIALFVIAEIVVVSMTINHIGPFGEAGAPGADYGTPWDVVIPGLIVFAVAIATAILFFLTAYVYRDARRRGMNAPLWTFLVIVLFPAYLFTGFVIYFLVREPLPFHCPQCGAMVSARFNYCPSCKYNLHPACPHCAREVRDTDRFCPYCGNDLASPSPVPSMPSE